MSSLMSLTATELASRLRAREVTARDAVDASLARIAERDPHLHAFIRVDAEAAAAAASALDRVPAGERGPLHGVPVSVKDVTDVAGMPTTHGSLLSDTEPAAADDVSTARLRAAGAVIVGKTNTPEFGFGAVCTNRICGPTRNPHDLSLTSGGSSGGSAVAVAAELTSLAQGADFGGSVRTPAGFTGTVGFRPTPGRIPEPGRPLAWNALATQGVLARTVDDAALMAAVMSGPDARDPLSLLGAPAIDASDRSLVPVGGVRVAASATLDGSYRIDPEVRSRFARAVDQVSGILGGVDETGPSTAGAEGAFRTLRAAQSWAAHDDRVTRFPEQLTESFVWNVRQGQSITAEEYLSAQATRSSVYRRFRAFFDEYDVLILPTASVMPFPNEQGEVEWIDGVATTSIIDYLACTFLISLVGFPAISIPAPSLPGELPFGLQLVARPYDEATLLRVARTLEAGGFAYTAPRAIESALSAVPAAGLSAAQAAGGR
ncbi:amidase [Microbacterium sp. NPDC057650]|uniref:amidase n=1 Tax=unclassified Microbacterium TaxID=2609290 RepID=UPI00366B8215